LALLVAVVVLAALGAGQAWADSRPAPADSLAARNGNDASGTIIEGVTDGETAPDPARTDPFAPSKVLDEPGVDEVAPSASDGYLVWTADSEKRRRRYNSYALADGGDSVRINPPGTQGPSASIHGDTIVYQEDTRNDEDLWFFDLVTETRSAPPRGVNTPKFEFEPSLSGNWLLFTRTNANLVPLSEAWVKVVLFDLSTGAQTVLKTLPRPYVSNDLKSGQVNGNWATFESCRIRDDGNEYFDCQVFLYDIGASGNAVRVTNPGVQQYGGSVSSDGTVYLMRTRNRDHYVCGSHAELVRVPVVGPGVVVARLHDGRDAYNTFALDEVDGSTTIYFDPFPCRTHVGGIYRIQDADTTSGDSESRSAREEHQ
jgi:hypothetical protein